jgi:uncharacterized PurR-regulated membrane protein YhhQ (DUF165 family)
MTKNRARYGAIALTGYIAAIVTANITTEHLGLLPLGLGLTVTAGTFWAGLALLLRNVVQDAFGRTAVFAAIAAGALLSALTSPSLALASGIAFAISETTDTLVYTPLRAKGWRRAAMTGTVLGALIDTLAFLTLAGFPVTFPSVTGQFIAKTAITWAAVLAVTAIRSARRDQVSRNPVNA